MNLCVIPARGGSKRIPKKNVKKFHGKPMIAYSIEAARKSSCFDEIIVSTDDPEIAEIAKSLGANVPFMRPKDLANDHAGTIPVVKHAIDWLEGKKRYFTFVCCLYATAPFVQPNAIHEAKNKLEKSDASFCFTATSFPYPIQRAIKKNKHDQIEMFFPENSTVRSQDLEEAYHDAGQFYWGRAEAWKREANLFSNNSIVYLLPRHLVQDIDTPEDWKRAELMYQLLSLTGELA